jgi:7,8-dihydropterin-6-yl-methyl-4-(beta-D-ribofuranosyl)aminobenzene 5'-phosphate synthase
MATEISILTDNRSADPGRFGCEHGLSVLLRTPSARILMDTGASGLFAANAALMGIDLSGVDYVFLSHGHYDHAGGLKTFLGLNSKAKVIVSPKAVTGRFYSERGGLHSISCDWPQEEMRGRTLSVDKTMTLADGIRVIASIPQRHPLPLGNRLLSVLREGSLVPDDFSHEMALYVDGVLYTGCAHNGLENILEACPWPVDTVIGGFHLLDSDVAYTFESEGELTALAERLIHRYPQITFYTGHCTGDAAFRALQSIMGPRLQPFACGMQIELGSCPLL